MSIPIRVLEQSFSDPLFRFFRFVSHYMGGGGFWGLGRGRLVFASLILVSFVSFNYYSLQIFHVSLPSEITETTKSPYFLVRIENEPSTLHRTRVKSYICDVSAVFNPRLHAAIIIMLMKYYTCL